MEGMHRARHVGRAAEIPCPLSVPPSQHLHIVHQLRSTPNLAPLSLCGGFIT